MTGAICIASGPSLTQADLDRCEQSGRTIYAVNDVWKVAPWAHHLYAADVDWWDYHDGVPEFQGQKWNCNPECCARWGLRLITATSSKKFAIEEPIATGGHSGFQALNLAYLHGHRDVWLLGYDLGFKKGTKKHFFGEHPQRINTTSNYAEWLKRFRDAKPYMDEHGLKVINMTRESALDVFERGRLCEYL